MQTVRLHGACTIGELAAQLQVSDETIRRNVKPLVSRGLILKVHGGIALPEQLQEPPFQRRMLEHRDAKQRVAALAAEQIENGEVASEEHCDEMLTILRRQFYSSRLPRRIRFRAPVAHKTGDWPPVAGNDAGIVYGDGGPIVVSVFATQNRGDFSEHEDTEGRIAEMLLEEWWN